MALRLQFPGLPEDSMCTLSEQMFGETKFVGLSGNTKFGGTSWVLGAGTPRPHACTILRLIFCVQASAHFLERSVRRGRIPDLEMNKEEDEDAFSPPRCIADQRLRLLPPPFPHSMRGPCTTSMGL